MGIEANWIGCRRALLSLLLSLLVAVAISLTLPTAGYAITGPSADPATQATGAENSSYSPSNALDSEWSLEELLELVGPIALYPDDLLALVLPASTFPLQVVLASRFLAARELDAQAAPEPDPDWDASLLALLNYPEALALLNDNLDWTWQLGEAVVVDQAAVMDAVQGFRHRVYGAGNLESNDQQVVVHQDKVIVIQSADPEVIYIPSYYPEHVVVVQAGAPLYYYSAGYPYYYHAGAPFWSGFYFGSVGFVFGLNWGLYGHPYHYRHHHHISVERRRPVHSKASRPRHRTERSREWKADSGAMQGRRPGRRADRQEATARATEPVTRRDRATGRSRESASRSETATSRAARAARRGESTERNASRQRPQRASRRAADSRGSADSTDSARSGASRATRGSRSTEASVDRSSSSRRSDRSDRIERSDSSDRSGKGGKADRSSKADRSGKAGKADKSNKSSKPNKTVALAGLRGRDSKRNRSHVSKVTLRPERRVTTSSNRMPRVAKARPRSSGRSKSSARGSGRSGGNKARAGGGRGGKRSGGRRGG